MGDEPILKIDLKLLDVILASSVNEVFFNVAKILTTSITKRGSFLFPLWGRGVRNGESVSTKSLSSGIFLATSLRGWAFGKVIIPEKEIKKLLSIMVFAVE